MHDRYLNPLYPRDFPDPFVLKHGGEYWAYCTGIWDDGRCFGILHSPDLVHWEAIGGAMKPLPGGLPCYWAPEVTYDNGRFYLYYSAGNEAEGQMAIRVAVADRPEGPFVDSGHQLTREPFAIDAHLFTDEDGSRYLFYATDFLDHERIGTGTVCDRLLDPFTLAGYPQPVTRARYDWQIYDPRRPEKGNVRWHTVEGSFVLKRKGLYYQMFSGGNWQNPSYGVAYATSREVMPGHEWHQSSDGEQVLPILRTLPGRVVGPGHNSVVRGPDNRQLYCVYHRWAEDRSGRLLAIDPLDWAGKRLLVLGPSSEPQPLPIPPTLRGKFREDGGGGLAVPWQVRGGQWQVRDGELFQQLATGRAEATREIGTSFFLMEVTLRLNGGEGATGIKLGEELAFSLRREGATLSWRDVTGPSEQQIPLPAPFDPDVAHLLRLELSGRRVVLSLDGTAIRWQGRLAGEATSVTLFSENGRAAFRGFEITIGWEELWDEPGMGPTELGWQGEGPQEAWRIEGGELCFSSPDDQGSLTRGPLLAAYESVVNVRLVEPGEGGYGFYPARREGDPGPLLTLERGETGWQLSGQQSPAAPAIPLPASFDPTCYQQFRFRKEGGRLTIHWEGQPLATLDVAEAPSRPALYAHRATVAFDMVRVTAISQEPASDE